MNIKDTVSIITGGASGLGEACTRNLVKKGGKVIIFDLQEKLGQKLADELGENALFAKVDVTESDTIKSGINKAIKRYGKLAKRLDFV